MSAQSLPVSGGLAGVVPALRGTPRIVAILAGIAIAALSVAAWLSHARSEPQVTTEPVARQTLTQSVTASGTVNAQNTIAVGTQISGTIAALNVDFNSKVRKGQVLARLDPSTMQAQLDQASAALAQTQAQADAAGADAGGANASVDVASANTAAQQAAVASAQANAAKAQDAVVLARAQFDRDNALYTQGFLAQATMQADRSNLTQSQAAAAAAEAAVAQARAQAVAGNATIVQSASQAQGQAATAQAAQASVAAARAIREEDQLNLDRTVITSPVDGTVVSRAVSVGQTVAASLQTPTLFSIAQDLRKMEVDINVGEPDIGEVKAGDPVAFTVLAYPTRTFRGAVAAVRINPQTVNNVVTYQVIVDVNNLDGKLLPGMTANATIDVASVPNALVVPLASLHVQSASGTASQTTPWGQTTAGSAGGSATAGSDASVTVQRNGKIERVRVRVELISASQAAVTPIGDSSLSEIDNVVTGITGAPGANSQARSPLSGGKPSGRGIRGMP